MKSNIGSVLSVLSYLVFLNYLLYLLSMYFRHGSVNIFSEYIYSEFMAYFNLMLLFETLGL